LFRLNSQFKYTQVFFEVFWVSGSLVTLDIERIAGGPHNSGYVTACLPVPIPVHMGEVMRAMIVQAH